MSVDHIMQALRPVKHPVSSSPGLPPDCYHNEQWLVHEMDCLFGHGWFSVGRVDQWQKPGDFVTINVTNIPIVIIMDKYGELRGMSNTCLHRSSQIMSGSGSCKVMVCPFHGWSYAATGQVISAPRMETAAGFSKSALRLKQFHVAARDGFVFLSLEDNPDPLDHWLGDFSDLHKPWSCGDLVTGRRRSFDVHCNWKLYIEVFNEYYHLPWVHADSINDFYPEPDPTDAVMGEYTSQFGRTTGNAAVLRDQQNQTLPVIQTLGATERDGIRYTWVYPNMTFAASSDCLWMYHVFPLSSARTRVMQTICFPADTVKLDEFKTKAEIYYQRIDLAVAEDIPALERQQTGIQSPYAVPGRFSALEPSVGNFACWYAGATGE